MEEQLEFDGFIKHKWEIKFGVDTFSGCDSPRDWDNLGKILTNGNNKYAPNEAPSAYSELADFEFSNLHDDTEKLIKLGFYSVPLSVYDHSGVSISIGEAHGWDCGVIGFYVAKIDDLVRDYGQDWHEKVDSIFEGEIETYDNYINGEVFEYALFRDDEPVDSLSGIYPCKDLDAFASDIAGYLPEKCTLSLDDIKAAWEKRYEN